MIKLGARSCEIFSLSFVFPRNLLTYLLIYLLTYLLSPWSRVLPEKRTILKLVKKFSAIHGTPRLITTFTCAIHLSLSSASSIQSISPNLTPRRFFLIKSTHLRLGIQVISFPKDSLQRACIRLCYPP